MLSSLFSWRSAETLAQIYTPMHLHLEGERDVCRWINGGANRESNLSRAAPAFGDDLLR
jgi:hypothetical protein